MATTRLSQMSIGARPYAGFNAKAEAAGGLIGNILFGLNYNMIHPIHESPLRPTDALTELTVRKRDKKPIITGGDH